MSSIWYNYSKQKWKWNKENATQYFLNIHSIRDIYLGDKSLLHAALCVCGNLFEINRIVELHYIVSMALDLSSGYRVSFARLMDGSNQCWIRGEFASKSLPHGMSICTKMKTFSYKITGKLGIWLSWCFRRHLMQAKTTHVRFLYCLHHLAPHHVTFCNECVLFWKISKKSTRNAVDMASGCRVFHFSENFRKCTSNGS